VTGKEPGHRMADYVDDKTVSLLKVSFDTRYDVLVQRKMEASLGGLGSLGWESCLVVFGFFAIVL
jgi:hypothetical protein